MYNVAKSASKLTLNDSHRDKLRITLESITCCEVCFLLICNSTASITTTTTICAHEIIILKRRSAPWVCDKIKEWRIIQRKKKLPAHHQRLTLRLSTTFFVSSWCRVKISIFIRQSLKQSIIFIVASLHDLITVMLFGRIPKVCRKS